MHCIKASLYFYFDEEENWYIICWFQHSECRRHYHFVCCLQPKNFFCSDGLNDQGKFMFCYFNKAFAVHFGSAFTCKVTKRLSWFIKYSNQTTDCTNLPVLFFLSVQSFSFKYQTKPNIVGFQNSMPNQTEEYIYLSSRLCSSANLVWFFDFFNTSILNQSIYNNSVQIKLWLVILGVL